MEQKAKDIFIIKHWHIYLNDVLFDINTCLMNIRILEIELNNNHSNIVNNLSFYKNYYNQQKFILVVQLEKMFSKSNNQKFNIYRLIKALESNENEEVRYLIKLNIGKFNDTYKDIDYLKSDLKVIQEKLDLNKDLLEKLKFLRNKIYAHTDKIDLSSNDKDITVEKFVQLKDLATEIYNTLLGKLFDEYYHFQFTEEWNVSNLLKKE